MTQTLVLEEMGENPGRLNFVRNKNKLVKKLEVGQIFVRSGKGERVMFIGEENNRLIFISPSKYWYSMYVYSVVQNPELDPRGNIKLGRPEARYKKNQEQFKYYSSLWEKYSGGRR